MNAAFVDEITACVLGALAAGERVEPAALQLLVRRYAATGREDVEAPLARALGDAVGRADADAAGLLLVCAEAAEISDDGQLAGTAAALATGLRREWGGDRPIAGAMRGIDACLHAAHLVPSTDLASAAVDELERIVAARYEPGEGLASGALVDQMAAAAALLTAHALTGRLPYAMLADELGQFARRIWWRDADGQFDAAEPFVGNCDAARVCCRLAALHADADYRMAAVIPAGAHYAADAGRALAALTVDARARGARAALYALALGEWLALGHELQ